jgi:DNA polymerase-3 subunit beta
VEIHFSENQISLSLNDTQIISRLVDGQYPDYRQIIPGEFKTKITTPKQSLQNALKTTSVFSQGTNSVSFNFSPEKQTLSLFTESSELGRSDIDIPSVVEGIEGKVILNNRYVQDCLAGMDTEKMEIKVIDDNSPSVMVPEGKTDYLYLVMPIKS